MAGRPAGDPVEGPGRGRRRDRDLRPVPSPPGGSGPRRRQTALQLDIPSFSPAGPGLCESAGESSPPPKEIQVFPPARPGPSGILVARLFLDWERS